MATFGSFIRCPFCFRENTAIIDLKVLPCTHVHCSACLTSNYLINHSLKCGESQCGKVFEVYPDTLPASNANLSNKEFCNVCLKKKAPLEGIASCTACSRIFNDKTPSLGDQGFLSETGTCDNHKGQIYKMACKVCHALKCQNCPSLLNDCENGTSHTLLPLNHLISMMFDEKIRQQMTTREKSFEALFKEASRVSAIEAVRTADMVDLIHQISNDQERRNVNVPQLKSQYKKMEDRVVMSGQRSQSALSEFMDVVLRQWQQLCNQRQNLEWRFKRSVPSETLSEWNEFDKIVEKFTKKALPTFVLAGQIELSQRDEEGRIALETISYRDIIIGEKIKLPRKMNELTNIQLPARPLCICVAAGNSYVGLDNATVCKIDSDYALHDSFISSSGPVESIVAQNDKLYTLSFSNPLEVNLYDMSGEHLTSWQHPRHRCLSNMMTIVADEIVIVDSTKRQVTAYSLNGALQRHMACSLLHPGQISVCSFDITSVVVSVYKKSTVFRFDVSTGEVMWTVSGLEFPLAIMEFNGYILLTQRYQQSISILNGSTGFHVQALYDKELANVYIYSLAVSGTTLLVPKFGQEKLILYQLEMSER